jgi:hypothetical protein
VTSTLSKLVGARENDYAGLARRSLAATGGQLVVDDGSTALRKARGRVSLRHGDRPRQPTIQPLQAGLDVPTGATLTQLCDSACEPRVPPPWEPRLPVAVGIPERVSARCLAQRRRNLAAGGEHLDRSHCVDEGGLCGLV